MYINICQSYKCLVPNLNFGTERKNYEDWNTIPNKALASIIVCRDSASRRKKKDVLHSKFI